MKTLKCLTLRRERNGVWEWLITNGTFMGKYTRWYGANCLADNFDCKKFLKNSAEMMRENNEEFVIETVELQYNDPNG